MAETILESLVFIAAWSASLLISVLIVSVFDRARKALGLTRKQLR